MKIFTNDYDRLDLNNHVRVLIPRSAIAEETLTSLRVRAGDDYLLYNPDNVLSFLERRHRIEAVRRSLTENNK
jgi:hypothetical protein